MKVYKKYTYIYIDFVVKGIHKANLKKYEIKCSLKL